MKREIKFRAINKVTGKFVYWDLFQNVDACIAEDTIGQYTGLKDKNGVEIYEGDIVEGDVGNRVHARSTSYKTCRFRIVMHCKDGYGLRTHMEHICGFTDYHRAYPFLKNCEVIGNVHQHAKLLDTVNEL